MAFMEPYTGPWTADEVAHLNRRAGFGARPGEIAAQVEPGLESAVSSLVDYEPVDTQLEAKINALRDFEDWKRIKNPEDHAPLQAWWLYRMAHTNQPLQEQFTLFLHDHFVSDWGKISSGVSNNVNEGNDGSDPEEQNCTGGSLPPDENRKDRIIARMMRDQNEIFRQRGYGNFQDLVLAITRDPAMLFYLDNRLNRKDRPQENFAREVMELFTMGVGNYSEEDVREVARAFTGESVKTACALDYPYTYFFFPPEHDYEEKTVFGIKFNERGRSQDTDRVIDIIMNHVSRSGISPAHDRLPAAAVYLAWKFITWFLHEEIPIDHPAVEELAEIFYAPSENGYRYDVRETLRTLFTSEFFYDKSYRFRMYKHPADYVVMAIRCLEIEEVDYEESASVHIGNMGMRLFAPPTVAGWTHGAAWINSSNLINRYNYADRLSRRVIMNRKVVHRLLENGSVRDENDHDGMIEYVRARLIQQPLNPQELNILHTFLNKIRRGDDIFRRKINGLAHIMMTMPKYQLK